MRRVNSSAPPCLVEDEPAQRWGEVLADPGAAHGLPRATVSPGCPVPCLFTPHQYLG